jgi:hypothetical protein
MIMKNPLKKGEKEKGDGWKNNVVSRYTIYARRG